MKLLVHRFLDLGELALVALAQLLQLGLQQRAGGIELLDDLLGGFALGFRQRHAQLALLAGQHGAHLLQAGVQRAAQRGEAFDALGGLGAQMGARRLRLRAGAVAGLLGQDAQVLQVAALAQHDPQRRERGDDGEADPDKLDRHAGPPGDSRGSIG